MIFQIEHNDSATESNAVKQFNSQVLQLLHVLKSNRKIIEGYDQKRLGSDASNLILSLHRGGTEYKLSLNFGLCDFLASNLNGDMALDFLNGFLSGSVEYYYSQWEHYSGSLSSPVPSTLEGFDSLQIQEEYQSNDLSVWSTDEYGQMRWDLIDHLIEKMRLHLD